MKKIYQIILFTFLFLFFFLENNFSQETNLPNPKDRWIFVKTENFTIFSSANEEIATNIGIKLERLRKTLTLITSVKNVNSPVPTWIYIFQDNKSLKPYLFDLYGKTPNLDGYFITHDEGNYIAISAQDQAMRTILHEYIHFFINNNMPEVPLWFNEGFAEYYSTFQSENNSAKIGLPVRTHVEFLQSSSLLPLNELFSIGQGSIYYSEETTQNIFYAQSWLFVHYLLRGKNGALKPKLNQYLTYLKRGQSSDEAFQKSFQMDYKNLQKDLKSYLMKGSFNYIQLSSAELLISPQVQMRPLAYEEVLYYLGDLIMHHRNSRTTEAEAYFKQAISLNPNYALAYAGLGSINLDQNNHQEAFNLFETAVKYDPNIAALQYKFGVGTMKAKIKSRLRISSSDPSIRTALVEARRAFQKSIMLDSKFYEAYAGFGETYIYDLHSPIDPGIKALERAHIKLPSRMDVAVNLLTLYARKGDSLRVQSLLENVIKKRANLRTIKLAQKRLFQVNLQKARQLFTSGKNEEVIQRLDNLPFLTNDPQLLNQVNDLRDKALRNEQWSLYNRGVRLANNKNFEEAIECLEKSVAINQDIQLTENSLKTLEQVKHGLHVKWYNEAAYLINDNKGKQAERLLKKVLKQSNDKELTKMAKEALEYIKGK